jgi:LysR family glycine cleavage system transcriptional activator
VLLHDETMRATRNEAFRDFPSWQEWVEVAGVQGIDTSRGVHLEMSSIVTDAAIAGAGVALGRSCVVQEAIRTGQLVRPFEFDYPTRFAYYLVTSASTPRRHSVDAFRDWLLWTARCESPLLQTAFRASRTKLKSRPPRTACWT